MCSYSLESSEMYLPELQAPPQLVWPEDVSYRPAAQTGQSDFEAAVVVDP